MDFRTYSYRFAEEIIQHENYESAWEEIKTIIRETPLFTYSGKSRRNSDLDVVQQMLNTFYDRKFAIEHDWDYHPSATDIQDSNLTADFYKEFGDLKIQSEIQFGNMARWYSDIFKFQTAYSQGKINYALSIVPVQSLANRIDSNVTYFERTIRELPSAKLSITLPILLIGLVPDEETAIIDLRKCGFEGIRDITGDTDNRFRIVNALLNFTDIESVSKDSPTGPIPGRYIV